MRDSRNTYLTKAAITAVILVCAHTRLLAEEDAVPAEDNEEAIEEIVVYAIKSGDQIDVDARYEELLRSRLATELERMRVLEEEFEWRQSESDSESSSRIKWGYDPKAELRMRRDTRLTDLPIEDTKPAALFRFEF